MKNRPFYLNNLTLDHTCHTTSDNNKHPSKISETKSDCRRNLEKLEFNETLRVSPSKLLAR